MRVFKWAQKFYCSVLGGAWGTMLVKREDIHKAWWLGILGRMMASLIGIDLIVPIFTGKSYNAFGKVAA